MQALDDEWLAAVSRAIGTDPVNLHNMIYRWWRDGKSFKEIESELMRLAEANGKKLILVNTDNN